jgi:hypothetical protein
VPEIPERVVEYIAHQVDVDPAVFEHYGARDNTIFEHLVESAKKLIRPLDLYSRDLIQTQYAFVRGALMTLYEALDVRAVRGSDPAIEALDYVQKLNARGRRVTPRRSRLGGERVEAPLGHVTDRWRRLVFEGRKAINASMYEVAAFEALNNGLRSGCKPILNLWRPFATPAEGCPTTLSG